MCPVAAHKTAVAERPARPRQRDTVRAGAQGRTRRDPINLAQSNSRNVPVCQKQTAACLRPSLGRRRASHLVKQRGGYAGTASLDKPHHPALQQQWIDTQNTTGPTVSALRLAVYSQKGVLSLSLCLGHTERQSGRIADRTPRPGSVARSIAARVGETGTGKTGAVLGIYWEDGGREGGCGNPCPCG